MSKKSKYRRGRVSRKQCNTILIVCGGETEKLYFKKINSKIANIKVKSVTKNENPKRIVEYAINEKKKDDYIQVWCVFDKDDFDDFDDAIRIAKKETIQVAYSNQAFELWFILHYQKQTAPMHRNKYENILDKHMGKKYNKTDPDNFNILEKNMNKAITNAKYGDQMNKKDGYTKISDRESTTTVYRLVEELQKWK